MVDEEQMQEIHEILDSCQEEIREAKSKIQQLQNNTMSKEAIGKIKENLNDKIAKINDETDQNCESLRQHIGALENAVSKISFA